jgi:hypothetical protein
MIIPKNELEESLMEDFDMGLHLAGIVFEYLFSINFQTNQINANDLTARLMPELKHFAQIVAELIADRQAGIS